MTKGGFGRITWRKVTETSVIKHDSYQTDGVWLDKKFRVKLLVVKNFWKYWNGRSVDEVHLVWWGKKPLRHLRSCEDRVVDIEKYREWPNGKTKKWSKISGTPVPDTVYIES